MPARVCIGLVLLLFFSVTWNLQLLTANFRTHWPLLTGYWIRGPQHVDEVTAYEKRFDSIRSQVAEYSTVGYRLIVPPDADAARGGDSSWRHFIANYTLSPTVLDSANKHPVTVVDRCVGPVRLRRRR